MKSNFWKKIKIGGMMAVYLLGLAGSPDFYVLCYGADGHLAMEAAAGAECAENAGHSPKTSLSGDHCGPCVDVPLSSDNSASFALKKIFAPALVSKTTGRSFQNESFTIGKIFLQKNVLHSLSPLQTVILRI